MLSAHSARILDSLHRHHFHRARHWRYFCCFQSGGRSGLAALPVPDPSDVVKLSSRTPGGTFGDMSYGDFLDYRDKLQSFDGLVAYSLTPFGFAKDSRSESQMSTDTW